MIQVSCPSLGDLEAAYAADAIRTGWISSTGPYVDRFEQEFARHCGCATALSACNGTAALHLSLAALGVGPGDEVIVPALTYVATANAVRYCGAEPVFADVAPDDWCLDPVSVADLIGSQTKAIVAVHLYGYLADMDALRELAHQTGTRLVEDAAEAHFATYKGKPTGSLGDLAAFSFYGNKIITCGEGGAVTDPTGQYTEQVRLLRGQGMHPTKRYYHEVVGYNYRLTNVACAILCAQLERSAEIMKRRKRVCDQYDELLGGLVTTQRAAASTMPAPWMKVVLFASEGARDSAAARLARDGVETRPPFVPLHELPPYEAAKRSAMDVAHCVARTGLCLPTHASLTAEDVAAVAELVREVTG